MAKIADAIKKVPDECVKTINVYASLIHLAKENKNDYQYEIMLGKLRGYLTSLVDLGLVTEAEHRAIYFWVFTGHFIEKKAGEIE